MNRNAPHAAKPLTAVIVAALNGMLRKKRRSRNGSARRDSYRRNTAKAAAATAAMAMTRALVHPSTGPSIRAKTTPNRKSTARPCPTGSMLRMVADLDSGTNSAVSRIAAAQMGRLIQKTERQPIVSISSPPTIGPSDIEIPTTAPQAPSARARSTRPVKICEMMDSATGLSIDPPIPCRNRAPMSASMDGARLHASEPIANSARPVWNTRRRPRRSPAAPASISSDASTSV